MNSELPTSAPIPRFSRHPMLRRFAGVAAGLALVVGVGAGCSSSGDSIASTSKDAKGGASSECTEATNGVITVVTEDFDYQPDCIEVTGDRLKVTYENKEEGIQHNIDFKDRKSASGPAKTDLKTGPNTQTITLVNLEPGTTTFVCDIHASMKGKLVVEGS